MYEVTVILGKQYGDISIGTLIMTRIGYQKNDRKRGWNCLN